MKKIIYKIYSRLKLEYNKLKISCYYERKIIIPFDVNWFKNKRVAIIGGADSVLQEPLGAYIDTFDVVVRINKGVQLIEKQSDFVGTRTDVLFHAFHDGGTQDEGSSPIALDLWEKHKVQNIILAFNYNYTFYIIKDLLHFIKITNGKKKFSQITKYSDIENHKVVEAPTTGFIAINTIFNCQPKELYLTGITFMKTSHNEQYRKLSEGFMSRTFHNTELEYEHIKKLYLKNPDIIKPDKILQKLFEDNSTKNIK